MKNKVAVGGSLSVTSGPRCILFRTSFTNDEVPPCRSDDADGHNRRTNFIAVRAATATSRRFARAFTFDAASAERRRMPRSRSCTTYQTGRAWSRRYPMRVRDVLGYEGQYAVSDEGHVIGLYRTWRDTYGVLKFAPSRVLKGRVDRKGYLRICLSGDGKEISFGAHRLVAAAFCAPYSGETVNHIDGDTLNNHHSNLEWCSGEANLVHEHLRKKRVLLTATQIDEIMRLGSTTPVSVLCARFNACHSVVNQIVHGHHARQRKP